MGISISRLKVQLCATNVLVDEMGPKDRPLRNAPKFGGWNILLGGVSAILLLQAHTCLIVGNKSAILLPLCYTRSSSRLVWRTAESFSLCKRLLILCHSCFSLDGANKSAFFENVCTRDVKERVFCSYSIW